jgi:hypothetical protein
MGGKRPDGGWGDPENLGRFLAPKIEEVEEHYRGSLALRKLAEGTDDLVSKIGGREGVFGLTGCQGAFRCQLEPAEPAARRVEGGPIQIPRGVVDAVPSFENANEGVLHQFLGVMAAPDDQVEGAIEPFVLVSEEVLEGQRLDVGLRIGLLIESPGSFRLPS